MKHLSAVDIGSSFFGSGGTGANLRDLTNVADLVSLFLKSSLVIAGVILLFFIILGGIGMIAGAGKDDPKKMDEAKQTLTTGVTGFVIVIIAYWIVKLILTVLGVPNII